MTNIKKGSSLLLIGALGIVFGDIGTSPLYALSVLFGKTGHHLAINQDNVFGVISLVIWSIVLVVSVKFIGFIMRADNDGEGGIMALIARIKSSKLLSKYKWVFLLLGIIGVGLFYGDSTITPAISVLSAIEGLKVVTPSLSSFVIPLTLLVLASLFFIQKYGTGFIGKLFGPIMLVWFLVIGLGGLSRIWQSPNVLIALSPTTAVSYFAQHPVLAFAAMGAVILAITGAEALYADMGHFGRPPIAKAWFFVVFPSLLLCYMGEGSLMLNNPSASDNPLVLLFPHSLQLPIVLLATIATIIASQAVISGAFSLTRQAVQLNFMPKMIIHHTSTREGGQIYMPLVNAILFIIVVILVLAFGSSVKMANAYGIAVSCTLAIDTILFLIVMRSVWQKSLKRVFLIGLLFIPIDLLFVSASASKLFKGGWFPVLVGIFIFIIISTWQKGEQIEAKERRELQSPLKDFIDVIRNHRPPIIRVTGTAIYIGHHHDLIPLALHATLMDMHELPEKVVIVSIEVTTSAHIPENKRTVIDNLGYYNDGISHVSISYGFHDSINIPDALRYIVKNNKEADFDLDIDNAAYFISQSRIVPSGKHKLAKWRKYLFSFMSRNALSSSDFYKLPTGRTEEMQTLIRL